MQQYRFAAYGPGWERYRNAIIAMTTQGFWLNLAFVDLKTVPGQFSQQMWEIRFHFQALIQCGEKNNKENPPYFECMMFGFFLD